MLSALTKTNSGESARLVLLKRFEDDKLQRPLSTPQRFPKA